MCYTYVYRNNHMEILPASDNSIYEERETGKTHTSFRYEYVLYQAIRDGNVDQIIPDIDNYIRSGLVVGHLSPNEVRQFRYWAVACISIAIHYAILGGMDETDAYNVSDKYIRHVDRTGSADECVEYLKEKAVELTQAVHDAKQKNACSTYVRTSLHYIHVHLHEKLMLADIARSAQVSPEYLSILFKKETGWSIHSFILREKLKASKDMLLQGLDSTEISNTLSFSSQSHYISCFRKEFGVTPDFYRKMDISHAARTDDSVFA
jgi:YesN/AraC family two-component response regulator